MPTLNALYDLRELGVQPHVGLAAYSPVLIEQLADNVVQAFFVDGAPAGATTDAAVTGWEREGRPHRAYLARFTLEWGRGILGFTGRYNRNLVAALRDLAPMGWPSRSAAPRPTPTCRCIAHRLAARPERGRAGDHPAPGGAPARPVAARVRLQPRGAEPLVRPAAAAT
ncbi:hypothetical protein [Kouleothrix sp.]|uniref:hypothetical protein n=1 Tax=Kouleothrix sp. TaxID=2779161 RepID=UPI00391DBD0C